MSTFVLGARKASLNRKAEFGHRVYKITYLIMSTTDRAGPAEAILTPGLPQYGDTWSYGEEVDVWAWCRYDTEVQQIFPENMRGQHWAVTFTFSTEPDDKGCAQQQIQNPLLQPPKISGSFTKFREETAVDRFGSPIRNSAWELLRGPQVEFDDARPTIKIEMNVASLNLPLLYAMRECVNAYDMWGFPPRCIKLSQVSWERLFYGVCFPYYKWHLEFELNPKTWDKTILDQGTAALNGHWDVAPKLPSGAVNPTFGNYVLDPMPGYVGSPNPDASIPSHFKRFGDQQGNPKKLTLDGGGLPAIGKPNGFGATAVINEVSFVGGGNDFNIVAVEVIKGGNGYTTPPAVSFSKDSNSH
jgi:hypothetical protein